MQPVSLHLQNFGPYANCEIDFQRFRPASLFLIAGKTGSGKTTIFDGMSFALYGVTSGGLREGKEMRSNFAEPTELTKVVYTFKHQNKYYIITRQPEQVLAKKRGDGTRQVSAKAHLIIQNGQKETIKEYTKQLEIKQVIEDLLHLDVNQFCQIILLPQGEFRRFLNADSNQKEAVLRKLFGTYFYRQLTEELKNKKKAMETDLVTANQKIQWHFQQVHWLTDTVKNIMLSSSEEASMNLFDSHDFLTIVNNFLMGETSNLTENQTNSIDNEQLLQLIIEEIPIWNQIEKQLKNELTKVNQKCEQVQTNYYGQLKIQQQFQQRTNLQQQQTELLEQAESVEALQKLVEKLNWCDRHSYLFEQVQAVSVQLQEQQQLFIENQEKKTKQQQVIQKLTIEKHTLTNQSEIISEKEKQWNKMEYLTPTIGELAGQQEKSKKIEQQQTELIKIMTDKEQNLQELQQQTEKLTQQLTQKDQILANIRIGEKAVYQLIEIQKTHIASLEIKKEQAEQHQLNKQAENMIKQLNNSVEQLKAQQQQAKSHWAELEIARLSADLLPNTPCPVCGSLEHPQLFTKIKWSKQEVTQTQQTLEKIENQLEKAQKECAVWQEKQQQIEVKQTELTLLEQNSSEQLTIQLSQWFDFCNQQTEKFNWQAITLLETSSSLAENSETNNFTTNSKEIEQTLLNAQIGFEQWWYDFVDIADVNQKNQMILLYHSHLDQLKDAIQGVQLFIEIEEKNNQYMEQLASQLQKLTIDLAKINQELQPLAIQKTELMQQLVTTHAIIKRLSIDIPETWQNPEYFEQEKHNLLQQIQAWKQALETVNLSLDNEEKELIQINRDITHTQQLVTKYQQQYETVNSSWQSALDKANLVEKQYLTYSEQLTELTNYQQKINKFNELQQTIQIQLQQLNSELADKTEPDVDKIKEQLHQIQEQDKILQANYYALIQKIEDNEKSYKVIQQLYQTLHTKLNQLAEVNELYEIAGGNGPNNKVSLERYVLQTYLEEILFVANQRLKSLSKGRYAFQLNEDQGSYKKTSGLELNIYDDNAGALRSVNTLSGGESFIAALSLALSLGEVVQARSGSEKVDAMFIDEGFGSLDDEALSMAIEALENIEGNDRVIGIISHVTELQTRVPQQLQVISDASGRSSVRYKTPFTEVSETI